MKIRNDSTEEKIPDQDMSFDFAFGGTQTSGMSARNAIHSKSGISYSPRIREEGRAHVQTRLKEVKIVKKGH